MKKNIILFYLLIAHIASFSQKYKAVYNVQFSYNSNDLTKIQKENMILIIDDESSVFASENFLKQDSVLRLVEKKVISPAEIMANPKQNSFKTKFNNFLIKNYSNKTYKVFNKLGLDYYHYLTNNTIVWALKQDTLTINNLLCYKAITNFEGRNYEAWYTQEIPISDGPYKFWGLPGLIIQINDTEKHYNFKLISFERPSETYTKVPYFESKSIEVNYEKFKIINKEFLENPLKQLSDRGMKIIGNDPPLKKDKLYLNSIERY